MLSFVLLSGFWAGVWCVIKWILVIAGLAVMVFAIPSIYESAEQHGGDEIIGPLFGAIVGFVPVLFWAIIPYWNVCRWIVMAALVAWVIVSKVKEQWAVMWIVSVALAIVFLFGAVIPSWSFFKYVFLVLACCGVLFLLYLCISRVAHAIIVNRRKKISEELSQSVSSVPIPENSVYDKKSEKIAKNALKSIRNLQGKIEETKGTAEEWKYRKLLTEEKLRLFYSISLRAESRSFPECYDVFEKRYLNSLANNDAMCMRQDDEEYEMMNGYATSADNFVVQWEENLKNDKTRNYSARIKRIQKKDTSGLFGFQSSSLVSQQTNDLMQVVNDAISEANELRTASMEINKELAYIRLCAYRNIFLGVELLNYIRDNAGGKSLTTQKDFLQISPTMFEGVNIDINALSFSVDNVINMAYNGYDTAMNAIRSLGFQPGKAASVGVGALAAVGAAFMENASKVSANRQQQVQIVQILDEIIPIIQNGQAGLLRSIELMKAIVQANNGFMAIYAPLREKVFTTGQYNNQEIMELINATSAFKKISSSNL